MSGQAVEKQVDCESSGGFWQYGYWSDSGEWKSTEGRCSYAPKEAYEVPRHTIKEETEGEKFDVYDYIDDDKYFEGLEKKRNYDRAAILGDFWKGNLMD